MNNPAETAKPKCDYHADRLATVMGPNVSGRMMHACDECAKTLMYLGANFQPITLSTPPVPPVAEEATCSHLPGSCERRPGDPQYVGGMSDAETIKARAAYDKAMKPEPHTPDDSEASDDMNEPDLDDISTVCANCGNRYGNHFGWHCKYGSEETWKAAPSDSSRLDWLMNWNVSGHPFKTRQAIDAAMKAQP